MAERPRDPDSGFTLIEVIVVTVLLGLIAAVIAFAITTVLRVTPLAESQVTNARSLQGLTAWFSDDAASVVAANSNINLSSPLKCADSEAAPGVNLVEFQWTVEESSPTTFVAAYRLEPDGIGHAVHRYECSGSGAPPYAGTTTQKLTGPIDAFNNVTWTTSPPKLALDLRTLDGTTIELAATPRSPDDTLPTTTIPAILPPPTPCAATLDPPTYAPVVGRVPSGGLAEKLDSNVDPQFDISGDSCGVLTIEYDTGYQVRSREITVSWPVGYVTIPQGDLDNDPITGTPKWTAGFKTIEVYNNGAPLDTPTTFVLEVTP